MVRKRIRSLARGPKTARLKRHTVRSSRRPGNRALVGVPAILLGFALIGYGILLSDAISLLIATLVFLVGLLLVWKR